MILLTKNMQMVLTIVAWFKIALNSSYITRWNIIIYNYVVVKA